MVKLTKRPLPDGVTIQSENDYRKGIVLQMLAEDCHNKCYICENKPLDINIEHIVSHRGDISKKYDWDNLFIACSYCNGIKGQRFNNILNPVTCDPEKHITLSLKMSDGLIESVQIEISQGSEIDESVLETAELLEYVYNGNFTEMKNLGAANLRNEYLLPDMQHFLNYIVNHMLEPDLGYDVFIMREISRSAKFAAFKRKIIGDTPFADYLQEA